MNGKGKRTAAVLSETAAVKSLTAADKTYTGVQIVTASMKWVPPQARMKSPDAEHPVKRNIAPSLVP